MKKTILIALLALLCLSVKAQRLKEYKASNGITYHLNDTVKLGRGSDPNGRFNYLQMGGWAAAMGTQTKIGAAYANTAVIIKNIKSTKIRGVEKFYFIVGGGNITNYMLLIDDAIQVCEVMPCVNNNKPQLSVADELTKLKGLLDQGAITQDEYNNQKKKLLNQ